MKNTSYFLLAVAFAFSTACGPNKKSTVTTTTPITPATGNLNNSAPATGVEPIPSTSPQSQAGLPTTAVALNPAHGMPNHRCEIPVGAPLNSTPQTNVSTVPKLPAPTLSLPAQGNYAAGTNPAHGLPGHDCSIPVGAPLKK